MKKALLVLCLTILSLSSFAGPNIFDRCASNAQGYATEIFENEDDTFKVGKEVGQFSLRVSLSEVQENTFLVRATKNQDLQNMFGYTEFWTVILKLNKYSCKLEENIEDIEVQKVW